MALPLVATSVVALNSSANTASYTTNAVTITAGANRAVAILVAWISGATTNADLSVTLTRNNGGATDIPLAVSELNQEGVSAGYGGASIFLDSAPVAGSTTYTFESTSGALRAAYIVVVELTGVDTSNPIGANSTSFLAQTSLTTEGADSLILGVIACARLASSVPSWSPPTGVNLIAAGRTGTTAISDVDGFTGYMEAASSASYTFDGNPDTGSWFTTAVVEIKSPSGGGGTNERRAGDSDGVATTAGVGLAQVRKSASAEGSAATSGVGVSSTRVAGIAAGLATALAQVVLGSAVPGTSIGESTVAGATHVTVAGASAGQSTVAGAAVTGVSLRAGTSAGAANVSGVGESKVRRVGSAEGAATASGVKTEGPAGLVAGHASGRAIVLGESIRTLAPAAKQLLAEPNPYRPDLPEDIVDLSPNLYDFLRDTAETLREQHNLTQAGDSTFSWEILTDYDLERRYNIGSLGRFYHPQFGIITARYCRFTAMRQTEWVGAPLGLRSDGNPLVWAVTNDFTKSSPDAIIGIGGSLKIPPEGSYGWVIVNGANIHSLALRKRTPVTQFDKFVWSDSDRVTVATESEGKVFGSVAGEYPFKQIVGSTGAGEYMLATTADRESTDSIMRFQPLFWACNFPSTMIASLTTAGETLIVDAEFTREDDLCGVIWESEDTWDHPLTAYDTNEDYSNCVLSFTIEISGDTLDLADVNGPVLTIEGKDNFGADHIWYVRLINYRTSGTDTLAQIVLDFDHLAGGFDMDDPVNPTEISRMFIGIVPASYTTDSPGVLTAKEVAQVKLSNISAVGSNAVIIAGTGTGVNELRMTNGYDDTYNLCPERLLRNVWLLGYRKWFNHYVGMSHYFDWQWDAGESRFIAQDLPQPLNGPCRIWHKDLCERLRDLDFIVIFSISYEMLNAFIPAIWRQLDSDGLPALTGWEPPSSLFSPCHETGMAYLDRVFVAFADILQETGLPIHIQVGEPWWWIDFRDFKPYFYDAATVAKWESDTGLTTPIMTTMVGAKNTAEIQYLNWLGDRLADSTAAKIQAVRDKYPDMVSYVLIYLPQVLSGFAGTPNTPDAKRVNLPVGWSKPAFDILQLEDYDFVINNEPELSEAGRILAEERLKYPRDEQQYFAGFVLFKEQVQVWEYTSNAIRQGWEFGVPEVFVWAYTQVMRDGYVNFLTSESSFREWNIPPGYAFINYEADSERRVKSWIDSAVAGSISNIAKLQNQVKGLKGAAGLAGVTARVALVEDAADENAYLISKESEQRSQALYYLNERLVRLESTGGSGGSVDASAFLNLQGVVNSLQGDFTSYIGFNNGRVDSLQTRLESFIGAAGSLPEELAGIYGQLSVLSGRITNLNFWQLADVPDSYTGLALQVPRIKADGSGIEFHVPASGLPAGGASGTILQKFGAGDGEATWSALTAGIVAFTPAGGLSSADVQAALVELDTEKASLAGAAFSGAITVPTDAYDSGWNGSGEVPNKDAIYDKIESMVVDIAAKLDGSPINNGDALIPTINSPWINYGAGFGGARYFKDAAGVVHLEGLIQATSGSPTSGVTLFTLLVGYRPADTMMFTVWTGGGAGRIDVDSTGAVIMQSGNTAFTSLSGISFIPA